MYRSLIVPLDGSPFAEHALPAAINLARHCGASLTLARVHVPVRATYTEGGVFIDEEADEHFQSQDRTYLESTAKRLKETFADVKVQTKLLAGEITEAIADEVKDYNHDLVVMTTHGRGAFGRIVLGSIADRLVRQLAPPLLLIHPTKETPELSTEIKFKHILIPLDGDELAEQIIEHAVALAKPAKAKCTLLRVIHPLVHAEYPAELIAAARDHETVQERTESLHFDIRKDVQTYLKKIAERLHGRGILVKTRIEEHDNPAAAIHDFVKKNDVDMVAMSTHARRGLARLLLGSVTFKLIRTLAVPVLVKRPQS